MFMLKREIVFTRWCEFFYAALMCGIFLCPKEINMQLEIIQTSSETMSLAYNIARVVYAETFGCSLRVVEALTTMISNYARKNNCAIRDVISDATIFESLNQNSERHAALDVDVNKREFQMCVRIAVRMLHAQISDMCFGATRFHRVDLLPDWAIARGYIADIDGILFYA